MLFSSDIMKIHLYDCIDIVEYQTNLKFDHPA